MTTEYDTLIIGGGMSGLAAGIRLAYFGKSVLIAERHYAIGGLNSFYRLRDRNYDVGLHAVTNFVPRGTKNKPLTKLLRQLRIGWDEFELAPQLGSAIAFPQATLRFSNDFALLEQEVAEKFPKRIDQFRRLVTAVNEFDPFAADVKPTSARVIVARYLGDPVLMDMLFCPLSYYGSAIEHDMDWYQFVIMFQSIFLEGFARPRRGVRQIIKVLAKKFKENGGTLRTRCGVKALSVEGDRVNRCVLDDGREIKVASVLSSAGLVETMRLCERKPLNVTDRTAGRISFMESVSVLNRPPVELGFKDAIVFFSTAEQFRYAVPRGLVDVESGVICSPNNYAYDEPLAEGIMRVTTQANYEKWRMLPKRDYQERKLECKQAAIAEAVKVVPDFRPYVVDDDVFTPTTIEKFTGHVNGAVYGAPQKRLDGKTHLENLFLCGTDQGFLGIVGAILSGISMANRHLLR